jgi:hypothetical protein
LGSGSLPSELAVARPAPGKSPLPYFALIVVLLAGVVGIYSYFKLRNAPYSHTPENSGGTTTVLPERTLSYSISSCQRVNPQDRTCAGQAKEYNQAIVFPPNSGLRLNISNERAGHFYIFNEDAQAQNGMPMYILLAPALDAPDASLTAGQKLPLPGEKTYNIADKAQGTEKLWLIWSPNPLPEFEKLRRDLLARKSFAITDAAEVKLVQDFIQQNETSAKAVAELDETQTHLKAKPGSLWVYPMKLERQ